MKSIDKIPTSKIKRAGKILQTGAKVGVNYIKYYGDKLSKSETEAREQLDQSNADDIYDGLKNLKGSALKVAQMLSMEKNILPKAYTDKFSLSQFSVPPLSAPLVIKSFRSYFGQSPQELFDVFHSEAINAASIGQVHKAEKDGKELAVKIQYPGVAESISSDLALIKPIAMRMFNIQGAGSDVYFKEVEDKLLEECDYEHELSESLILANECSVIPHLRFPHYYKKWSSERIITMDWMQGRHLSEFTKVNDDNEISNKLGQALWDFYMFQIHSLRKFHADPHPGNFLVSDENELIVLDFGCVKEIPDSFYQPYIKLIQKETLNDPELFEDLLFKLEILRKDDNEKEKQFFMELFHELLMLFARPFQDEYFDFSDDSFFVRITELGESYTRKSELRKMNANRGSRHFIYLNRTFFGLYSLLHELGAERIKIWDHMPKSMEAAAIAKELIHQ